MSSSRAGEGDVQVDVENVGGIGETSVEFSPGVTVLAGRNATNRTSLLRAIMAALGGEDVSLKGDADEGRVELTIGGRTYTRTLRRRNGTTVTRGDPYLDDPQLAELFAFLLEGNEARRAVEGGEDLREVIMRPVDTDEIDAEIARLEARREGIQRELDDLGELEGRLPGLEEKRRRLREEIEELQGELEAKRDELDEHGADLEETRTEKAELDGKLDELRERRNDLEDIRYDIESQQRSLDALCEEREELEGELASLPDVSDDRLERLDEEIGRLRDRRRTADATVNELQTVIGFNEDLLDGGHSDVVRVLQEERAAEPDGSIADGLLADGERTVCPTCGSAVPRSQIEGTVDLLRRLRSEKLDDRRTIEARIDELEAERTELTETREERERLEERLDRAEAEREERRARIEDLTERRDGLESEIDRLESEIEELQNEDYSEVLDLHREVNRLEFELDRLRADREELTDEIEAIEERLGEREELESELAEVGEGIEDLRTRIERLEAEAVEAFNDQMDVVLDLLGYENLERIWIERIERDVREGRRTVSRGAFELHIVRTTETGSVYEDTIDHLSESEREVVGLVFALAGYLTHDVHETVPFVLLDSLEALDAERIAALVEYLGDYAEYLVVALLPEDAAALDDGYERIADI